MRGPALASVVRPVVIVGGHIRPHGSDRVAELSYGGIEPACMVFPTAGRPGGETPPAGVRVAGGVGQRGLRSRTGARRSAAALLGLECGSDGRPENRGSDRHPRSSDR